MRTCRKNLTCSAYLLRRFSGKKVTGRSILGREHEPRVARNRSTPTQRAKRHLARGAARIRSVLHTYLDVSARKRSQLPPSSTATRASRWARLLDAGAAREAASCPRCRANPAWPAYLLRRFSEKKVTAPSVLDRDTSRYARLLDADAAREAAPSPRRHVNRTCPAYLLRRFSTKKVTALSILDSDISLALRATARRGRCARTGTLHEVPRESDLSCIPT